MRQLILFLLTIFCLSFAQAQKVKHPLLLYTPERIAQVKQRIANETKMVVYFLSMQSEIHKVYSTPGNSFQCCAHNHAKYGEAIYYHNDKGIYVNLFIPSQGKLEGGRFGCLPRDWLSCERDDNTNSSGRVLCLYYCLLAISIMESTSNC